jgi:kinesin family protein 6/9
MNEESSRAHCVYTIHVQSRNTMQATEKVVSSKLHLVDLAGNERTKKLSESERVKEANYINKSLSFLEQVVVAACDNKKEHVPYRQSKLTNLLKNSIGGNCKTVMIANIWPEQGYLEETISTLRFASRMMKVQNEAKVNQLNDPVLHLKKL